LPAVLYGCDTWSLILKEERRLGAYENRVLRTISGPKRDETVEAWRELHTEVLHNLYSSPNIIKMKSRKRFAGYVARMGEQRHTGFSWGSRKEGDHQEDPDVGERIILKWILERKDGEVSTGLVWLMIGTSGGLL
jgi:hypothetical protein